ncbi:MAG TPA: prepilin-type N-terminal cleavage/methylation domain-containing protein [Humisphaera sp.]|jgi:prepilin-type N-terminal cleavage/methylation domain-containing protein/prepilin-type processing-associated H-X9-DG protein|nr:prepilin-type N-terminal cleavage/methylation domain-containing protein [Humisphaera sp.]
MNSRSTHRQFRQRAGFSLPELLVVIGIIALLISILLPTMAKMREQANQVKCLANLRSYGQAAQLHANDHRNYFPCAGWIWNPTGGIASAKGMDDDQAAKFDYYSDEGERRPLPFTAALARYMSADVRTDSRQHLEQDLQSDSLRRLWLCPSQEVPQTGWTQRAQNPDWQSPDESSSYVFNEAILGRRNRNPAQSPFPAGQNIVRHSSEVFLIMDGRTRDPQFDRCFLVFDYGGNDSLLDFQRNIQNGDLGKELLDFARHRRRLNVLYVDGHAATSLMDDGSLDQIGVSRGIYQ